MTDEQEPKFHHWVELHEAKYVKFGDLPGLMARAKHSDDDGQAFAEVSFAKTLSSMVLAGAVQVLDPLTGGPHPYPVGEMLKRAVMIPRVGVRELLATFHIGLQLIPLGTGPTHWTIENAATAIAVQEGWGDDQRLTLVQQLMVAVGLRALPVRNPHTELVCPPKDVRGADYLVTPHDVNAWLEMDRGGSFRWRYPPSDASAMAHGNKPEDRAEYDRLWAHYAQLGELNRDKKKLESMTWHTAEERGNLRRELNQIDEAIAALKALDDAHQKSMNRRGPSGSKEAATDEVAPAVNGGQMEEIHTTKRPVWWKTEDDLFDMAQNIWASLNDRNDPRKRPSKTNVAKEIAKRIQQIERGRGRDRKCPDWETVRKALIRWMPPSN